MQIKEWVLGDVSVPVSIVAVRTQAPITGVELVKIAATMVGVSDAGATTILFPPYDPAAAKAPAETRVYAVVLGDNGAPLEQPPADADGYIASSLPYSSADAPVPPEGAAAYVVPVPASCVVGAKYVFQVLHGYA